MTQSPSVQEQLIFDLFQAENAEARKELLRARANVVSADLVAMILTLANEGSKLGEHQTANDLITIAWEIAEHLHCDRNTVTKAMKFAYQSRGLPVPDGRTRRKSLDRKVSRPRRRRGENQGDDEAAQ